MMDMKRAREIAAQYQTPRKGDVFSAFASTGVILRQFYQTIGYEASRASGEASRDLLTLYRFVGDQHVEAWSTGYNNPGYRPHYLVGNHSLAEWDEVVTDFRGNIDSAVCGCPCECDGTGVNPCHSCVDDQEVVEILARSDMPNGSEPVERRGDHSVTRPYPACPTLPEVYWLRRTSGLVRDLFAE
jgi:hypothetical protein